MINKPVIYPIGGGKGGIGKSFITANLGSLLATEGKKVVLVDLDLGGANLHTFLGRDAIENGIGSFLDKTAKTLGEVAATTDRDNLFFISSSDCTSEIANLYAAQKSKLIRAIRKLDYDYVFLDLGGGIHFNTIDFFLSSNQGIFVLTAEPTAIENAFNFIKAVYFRIVKKTLKQNKFIKLRQHLNLNVNAADQSFRLIREVNRLDPEKGVLLQQMMGRFHFHFIVNQLKKNTDPSIGNKIETVCNQHFYSRFNFLGTIRYDEKIHDSLFSKKTFIDKYTYTLSAQDLKSIAKQLSWEKEADIYKVQRA